MERKVFANFAKQSENVLNRDVSQSSSHDNLSIQSHENTNKDGRKMFLPIMDKKYKKESGFKDKKPLHSKNSQEGSSTRSDSSTEYSCLASLKSSNSKKKIRPSKVGDKSKRSSSYKRLTKQTSPGCLCDPGTESRTSSSASPLNSGKDSKILSDNLSRKERLEALKARIEEERERYLGSSSDEEERIVYPKLSRYNSDDALYKSRRPRKHLRRMSYDETGLLLRKSSRGCSPLERRHSHDSNKSLSDVPHKTVHLAEVKDYQCKTYSSQEFCPTEKPKGNYNEVSLLSRRSDADGSNNSITFSEYTDVNKANLYNEYKDLLNFGQPFLDVPSNIAEVPRIFQPSPLDSGVSSQSVPSSPSLVRAPTPPPRSVQTHSFQPPSLKPLRSRPLSAALVSDYREKCRQFGDPDKFSFYGYLPRKPIQSNHRSEAACGQGEYLNNDTYSSEGINGYNFAHKNQSPSSRYFCAGQPLSPDNRKHNLHCPDSFIEDNYPRYSEPVDGFHGCNLAQNEYIQSNNFQKVQANCYDNGINLSSRNENSNTNSHNKSNSGFKCVSDVQLTKCVPKFISSENDAGFQRLKLRNNKGHERKHINSSFKDSPLPPVRKRLSGGSPKIPSSHSYEQKHTDSFSSDPPPPPIRKRFSGGSPSNKCDHQDKQNSGSKNLDKAFTELEEIYKNLNLDNDKDLLDRAERRDLPTKFQLSRETTPLPSCRTTKSANSFNTDGLVRSYSDNIQSLLRQNEYGTYKIPMCNRASDHRYRRSGVPDKIKDDLAYRKQKTIVPVSSPNNQKFSSYLLCSPHFTPSMPQENYMQDLTMRDQPDIEQDDLSYRMYAQSVSSKNISPQPPFGIPLRPVPQSSHSDYLHAKPNGLRKPIFRPQSTPDVVTDDMAFRTLRKDEFQVTTHRGSECGYLSDATPESYQEKRKQFVVKSLSANIAQLMTNNKEGEKEESDEFQEPHSTSKTMELLERESNKWQKLENSIQESDLRKYTSKSGLKPFSEQEANNRTLVIAKATPRQNVQNQMSFNGCSDSSMKSRKSKDSSSSGPENDFKHYNNTHSKNDYRYMNELNSIYRQQHFYPTEDLSQNECLSNSEIRPRKITPLDESHLDELLTSLAHDTRDLPCLHPPVAARHRTGPSNDDKSTGELHGVAVLA